MNEERNTPTSEGTGLRTSDIAGTTDGKQSTVSQPKSESVRDGSNVTHIDGRSGNQTNRPSTTDEELESTPLLPDGESYRNRWQQIQGTFVDDPRDSVSKADGLVAEVIQTLAKKFAEEREHLENDWGGGRDPSTEDLRKALQHYRTFFQRLLAA